MSTVLSGSSALHSGHVLLISCHFIRHSWSNLWLHVVVTVLSLNLSRHTEQVEEFVSELTECVAFCPGEIPSIVQDHLVAIIVIYLTSQSDE